MPFVTRARRELRVVGAYLSERGARGATDGEIAVTSEAIERFQRYPTHQIADGMHAAIIRAVKSP
jgi:hypothetical protein